MACPALRIKTFVGTSVNALKIQIWTALIALLLARFLQLRSRVQWRTSRFIDHSFDGPLKLRQDFMPDQNTLFTDEDVEQQGASIDRQGKIAPISNHFAGSQPGSRLTWTVVSWNSEPCQALPMSTAISS